MLVLIFSEPEDLKKKVILKKVMKNYPACKDLKTKFKSMEPIQTSASNDALGSYNADNVFKFRPFYKKTNSENKKDK